jgi:hypothetical protein
MAMSLRLSRSKELKNFGKIESIAEWRGWILGKGPTE